MNTLQDRTHQAPSNATRARVDIAVTEDGFVPETIQLRAGEPTTLAFTRHVERTCAKQVAIDLGRGNKVQRSLPLHETVLIDLQVPDARELTYACPMNMIQGVITVM